MRFGRDHTFVIWIVYHEVGIGSHRDRALARIQTENLGRLRARDVDKPVQIESALFDAMREQQIDAVLERRNAIRNFRKITAAHFLLALEIKRRVISGQRVDESLLQSVPQVGLIFLVTQRRRHHIFRAFKIRQLGVGHVGHQILNQRFDPHLHPTRPGGQRLAHRLFATGVHQIHRSVEHFGKSHQMVHAFGLNARRTARMVPLRFGLALGQQLLLHHADQFGIFAMRGGDDPK